MNEVAALRTLVDEVALWDVQRFRGTHDIIWAAADALAVGIDSPSLRELAGCSAQDSGWIVEPLIDATFDELGFSRIGKDTDDAQIAAARAMSAGLVSGRLSARDFTTWAHRVISHVGSDVLQPLVMLDDYFDDGESAGISTADIDAEALSMAKQLLADELPLTETLAWPANGPVRVVPSTEGVRQRYGA